MTKSLITNKSESPSADYGLRILIRNSRGLGLKDSICNGALHAQAIQIHPMNLL